MYPNRFRHRQRAIVERLNEGIAHREAIAKLDAIEAEMTRFKGPQPINEAVVAYGSALQQCFNEMRGDSTYGTLKICAKLEMAMRDIRNGFTERQKAYRVYEPTAVYVEEGRKGYISLRLDGWEIGTIQ
ncbi:hypothetical protein D3C87_1280950 [compost metagenome]